jgi:hypothetical protein
VFRLAGSRIVDGGATDPLLGSRFYGLHGARAGSDVLRGRHAIGDVGDRGGWDERGAGSGGVRLPAALEDSERSIAWLRRLAAFEETVVVGQIDDLIDLAAGMLPIEGERTSPLAVGRLPEPSPATAPPYRRPGEPSVHFFAVGCVTRFHGEQYASTRRICQL